MASAASNYDNNCGGSVAGTVNSVGIAQLAVDSHCVAGEFREIVVTLDSDSEDGTGGGAGSVHGAGSVGSSEVEELADDPNDVAFGLDPRDISQLDDDADDDDDGEYGRYQQQQQQQRGGNNGNNTNDADDGEDYGLPQVRTPPRHPHGPREGHEHMVVLSASQKKLRDKLLRGYSGGKVAGRTPNGADSGDGGDGGGFAGSRLDQHFASPGVGGGIPRPHDRSVLGGSASVGGVPRSISTNNLAEHNDDHGGDDDVANSPSASSMISGVTNFTDFGGEAQSQAQAAAPPQVPGGGTPTAQYRSSWMLPNHHKQAGNGHGVPGSGAGGPDYTMSYLDKPSGVEASPAKQGGAGPDYTMSYLDKPSGMDASPASLMADRRMAAAMRAAGTALMPMATAKPRVHHQPSSGNSVHSAPGPNRSNSSSSNANAPLQEDDVMRSVANRVKSSLRMASPPPAHHPASSSPLPPRPRSVSPKPNRSQLRHREYNNGGAGGPSSSSIVFGAPDTFGAAAGDGAADSSQGLPSIRDRARALNDWMGGKGVKIEKEVRPTAGYTNDDMYQNSYLRRTSPQVTAASRKTIEGARASLTPPKVQVAPNSGIFAHGSAKSSAVGRESPAFLTKFQDDDDPSPPSSPEAETRRLPNDRELPSVSVAPEVAAATSDQGTSQSSSAQASPASLKENAAPPPPSAKSISTGNNDDASDMAFLRSWGKSRVKQQSAAAETPTSLGDDTFPGSPKFDDDGFGDVVSMNGGGAWGTQSAHDDDAWENNGADDFGEPFYS